MTGIDRWLPLNDALADVSKRVGSDFLAFEELKLALVDGRIEETEERSHDVQGGNLETRKLTAKFWQTAKLEQLFCDEHPHGHVKVTFGEMNRGRMYHYFAQQRYLEKLWPSASNQPIITASPNETPWRKKSSAGAKGDYDWEAILTEAAVYMYENSVPKSLNGLCRHIETWCGDDAPSERTLEARLESLYKRFKKADSK